MNGEACVNGRRVHRPTGAVDWTRFLPLAGLALLVSAALALALYAGVSVGFYILFVMPLLAAVTAGGCVWFAVSRGHCRSSFVGGLLGLACAMLLSLGPYVIGLVHAEGARAATQPELVARYIVQRMNSDSTEMHGAHGARRAMRGIPPGRLGRFCNWADLGFGALVALLVCCVFGAGAAELPYCTICHQQLRHALLALPRGSAPAVVQALNENRLGEILRMPLVPDEGGGPYTAVSVEYCPRPEGSRCCPVYLSVKELRTGGTVGSRRWMTTTSMVGGTVLLSRSELTGEEVALLTARLPELSQTPFSWPARELEAPRSERSMSAPLCKPGGMQITAVPAPRAGALLSRSNVFRHNVLPWVCLVGSGVLCIVLIGVVADVLPYGSSTPLGLSLLVLAGLLFAAGPIYFLVASGNRRLLRLARQRISARADCLVRADDPAAILVKIIPMERVGQFRWEKAIDVGFLRVDEQRRELLFEGDRERYQIPAHAIRACERLTLVFGHMEYSVVRHYAELRVHAEPVEWHCAILPLRSNAKKSPGEKKLAGEIVDQVRHAMLIDGLGARIVDGQS